MIKNEEKITKEFCRGKILLFYPQTIEEAESIQRTFFNMGYKWGNTKTTVIKDLNDCVDKGLQLDDGKLYSTISEVDLKTGLLCTIEQLNNRYRTDRELILELFNKVADLSAELKVVAAQVKGMHEEVMPRALSKAPVLKRKDLK